MLKKVAIVLFISCFAVPSIAKAAFDYDKCVERAASIGLDEEAKCRHSKMLLDQKELQSLYDVVANNKDVKAVTREQIKKMYDGWANYRDTYCELYASLDDSFTPMYNRERCLQEHTETALLYMQGVLRALLGTY